MNITIVLFPRLTQLDATGPYEVFARMPGARVCFVAATREPVKSDRGMVLLPDATFADAPSCDLLMVPGGAGVNEAMLDPVLLAFVRDRGHSARYVTSVCTGSLILGAAGLLEGYEATTHWASREFLAPFGATVVNERWHIDRNRITGGGVTSGIDFALAVVAQIAGDDVAQSIQLQIEYEPFPPFDSGSPESADPETVAHAKQSLRSMLDARKKSVEAAAAALHAGHGKNVPS